MWNSGFRIWALGSGLRVARLIVYGLRFGVWGFGLRFSVLGFMVSGFGLRVDC